MAWPASISGCNQDIKRALAHRLCDVQLRIVGSFLDHSGGIWEPFWIIFGSFLSDFWAIVDVKAGRMVPKGLRGAPWRIFGTFCVGLLTLLGAFFGAFVHAF